jgi:hypothetical protein
LPGLLAFIDERSSVQNHAGSLKCLYCPVYVLIFSPMAPSLVLLLRHRSAPFIA